jgi:hypothetical protein
VAKRASSGSVFSLPNNLGKPMQTPQPRLPDIGKKAGKMRIKPPRAPRIGKLR